MADKNIRWVVERFPKGNSVGSISVEGVLNLPLLSQLEQVFSQLWERGVRHVIMDCTNLKYIVSSGIGLLKQYSLFLQSHGGAFALAQVPKHIRELIELLALESVIVCFDSMAEARAEIETLELEGSIEEATQGLMEKASLRVGEHRSREKPVSLDWHWKTEKISSGRQQVVVAKVELQGAMDSFSMAHMDRLLEKLSEKEGAKFIFLDCREVVHIGSIFFAILIKWHDKLAAEQGGLALIALQEPVRELMESMGLVGILHCFSSLEEAEDFFCRG